MSVASVASELAAITRQLHDLGADRDRLIVAAHGEGASLREIARLAGMSHPGVKKIIDRGVPEAVVVAGGGNVARAQPETRRAPAATPRAEATGGYSDPKDCPHPIGRRIGKACSQCGKDPA